MTTPNSRVTRTVFGELIRDTAEQLAAGVGTLTVTPFDTRAQAVAAVAAYRDLAYALARAGSQLLGPAEPFAGLRHATRPDLTDIAMLHLVDDLHRLGHPRPFHVAPPAGGAGAAWAEASRTAGAAADLLATHRGPDGQRRTPTPVLDDPAVRRAGYAQLAALAGPLAGAAPVLARRAVDAGADWTRLEHLLPNAELAARSATDVRALARAGAIAKTLANTLAGAERLDTLQVARPAVRTGEPLVELGDRWARLHRTAWQLSRDPRPGVGTLADYATAAVLLTEATGAVLNRAAQVDAARGRPAQPWQRQAHALAEQATGWRQVRVELAALRTPTPALLGVRADIHALRDLLIALSDPRTAAPAIRSLPVLLAGTRTLPDLATFNAATLDRIAATGDLYVTGAALPRDLLSDNRTLAAARLRNTLVAAPPELVDPARDAYRTLLQPPRGDIHAHRAEPPGRSGRDPSGRLTHTDHRR